MSHNLELAAGDGQEYFPLHQVDWDRNEFNGTLRFSHNTSKFANIIDMYIGMIKSDLENKYPKIELKYRGKDDEVIEAYNSDLHEHQLHVSRLWRWIAMHPHCMLHTT